MQAFAYFFYKIRQNSGFFHFLFPIFRFFAYLCTQIPLCYGYKTTI